jgi:hypothetical protein
MPAVLASPDPVLCNQTTTPPDQSEVMITPRPYLGIKLAAIACASLRSSKLPLGGNMLPQNRELAGRFRSQSGFFPFKDLEDIENVRRQALKGFLR